MAPPFYSPGAPKRKISRSGTMDFGLITPTTNNDDIETQPFRLSDVKIDTERICSSLDNHKRFKVKEGYEMKDLPKFDGLDAYGIDEEHEMRLWKFEVRRLKKSTTSETPLLLEGLSSWYGTADAEGYNRLHKLARTLLFALDVCMHDTQLLLMEYQPQLGSIRELLRSQKRMLQHFDPDEGIMRYGRNISLAEHNDKAYHALVNYVTATVARISMRTVDNDLWVDNFVSTLAKYSAKVKVVGTNLPAAVSQTILSSRELKERMAREGKGTARLPSKKGRNRSDDVQEDSDSDSDDESNKRQYVMLGDEEDVSGMRYYIIKAPFSRMLYDTLYFATQDLAWGEELEQTGDVFEAASIIYDTGFRGTRAQLCQERNGSIGTTGAAGERNVIRFASVAFDVSREIWSYLPHEGGPARPCTVVDWSWTTARGSALESVELADEKAVFSQHRALTNMKDVITALVPFSMLEGLFCSQLSQFVNLVVHISGNPTRPVKYYTHDSFLSAARIRTSQFERTQHDRPRLLRHQKYQNVCDTVLARQRALARFRNEAVSGRLARYKKTNKQFSDALEEASGWIIDTRAIIIPGIWYSWIVLAGVGILVVAGLGLVAVQNRIAGVDPSNLSVLVWTAAGFLMVYFKSQRVENWPWRDFLRGRVVCRSVSEVVSVTKIRPQLLIAILLRKEPYMFLEKGGPFNQLFQLKSADGFAIDVPPMVETAMAGGYLFVRVNTSEGSGLVSVPYRRSNLYQSVRSPASNEKGSKTCRDFLEPEKYHMQFKQEETTVMGSSSRSNTVEPLPFYAISDDRMDWHSVQGVFTEEACFS